MSEAEVIDLGADPEAERRAARRRLRRVVAPIAASLLLALSVLALIVAGHQGNKSGALALSGNLLDGLERRIALRVTNWLGPAERALSLLHAVYGDRERLRETSREEAATLAIRILDNVPSIALVSLADTAGNYVLQRRNEQGGIDTKQIDQTPGPRRVTWVRRDREGNVRGVEEDPADSFDPRVRPWFLAAVATDRVVWTDPYLFFTDRAPGVTAAIAFREEGEVRGVLGVDIRLADLSAFLGRLEIGRTGRAIIVDRSGRVVAHPDPSRSVRDVGGMPVRPRLDELGDPVLTRAYDVFRINGNGRFTLSVGGRDHLAIWSSLPDAGDGTWSMLITVPEEELVGFVATASRMTGLLGAVVVLVAIWLAYLLVRQGLRADRMERTLERQGQAMAAQAAALAELGRSPAVHDPDRDEGLAQLTATLSRTLGARRASIWRLAPSGESLVCEDIHDAGAGSHGRGQRLARADHAGLFAALARGDAFEAEDAAKDPRTAALCQSLIPGAAGTAVLVVPALRGARLVGAVIVEERARPAAPFPLAAGFCAAIATMAAGRMVLRAPAGAAHGAARDGASGPATLAGTPVGRLAAPPPALREALRDAAFTQAVAVPIRDGLAAEVFPAVTVLALQMTDTSGLAEQVAGAGGCTLADEIVSTLQGAVEHAGIAYLRVMGDRAIVADGFGDRAEAAAETIPAFALDLAERLGALFASLDRPAAFRIGIDSGTVIGSAVGRGARSYNIWGEAVRGAEALAASAPPGTVQVTEALRARLGPGFVLRPRGRFWLPGSGETGTFLLAGRA